jgi:endonuclease/exonuclease/phosphatase family metal-dependent hydrolase
MKNLLIVTLLLLVTLIVVVTAKGPAFTKCINERCLSVKNSEDLYDKCRLRCLTRRFKTSEQSDAVAAASNEVVIGSFNIQVFGGKKMLNTLVVQTLIKTLARYDLVLVQEVRDSADSAIHELLQLLKAKTGKKLQMSISARLGRTNSKEQYAYIYDSTKFQVLAEYQFEDEHDWFERAPYSILVQTVVGAKKMMLSGVHISPGKAVAEIDRLVDVYQYYAAKKDLSQVMKTNWIVMGDMNADCSYVSKSKWSSIRLRTDDKFHWLVKDGTDTTVATSVCAYDRFVTTHAPTSSWVKSVNVFNFGKEFKLSEADVKKVSDHYPIELTLIL